jgi:putative transposase
MSEELKPKDHAERVALFRAQLLGPLLVGELVRGELADGLRELAAKAVVPPGGRGCRSYAVPTLERWFYAYRDGGLDALKPKPRSDRGMAQALTVEQRELLLAIRRDHPRASTSLVVRTLVADGRLPEGAVSDSTVRRLYAEHGLDRATLRREGKTGRKRRRWQAAAPGVLWHADVCHGPTLTLQGRKTPLRIHALLDDVSRYVLAIAVVDHEKESAMLTLLVRALRLHPAPDVLYLDNGSTYSGDTLQTACARLGITLLHARPDDPEARGKMERFWRTMREGCLDYLGEVGSLHDVQVRLRAFVDQHYHRAAHSSLFGRCPQQVWEPAAAARDRALSEKELHEALVVRTTRQVKRDGTIAIGGQLWEADEGFLAGRAVTIARSLLDPASSPWVEHEEKVLWLRPVDPAANGQGKRCTDKRPARGMDVPFDPPTALLRKAIGSAPRGDGGEK